MCALEVEKTLTHMFRRHTKKTDFRVQKLKNYLGLKKFKKM